MKGATRKALLDTAERVVRQRGFDGFSFADLSDAVGIRKASIHHHFPTKAKLSVALLDRYYVELDAACAMIERHHATGAAQLAALVALYRDALDGGSMTCLCVALTGSRESLSVEAQERIVAFREMMTRWIAGTVRRGIEDGSIRDAADPEDEARAILATLEGAHLAARAAADASFFDGAVALLRARLARQS